MSTVVICRTAKRDDRVHNFADGVYEVILVVAGRMMDEEGRMVRL